MNEVQELSDEIVFLLEGEIKFKGSVQSLLEDKKETKLERAIAELDESTRLGTFEVASVNRALTSKVSQQEKNK